MKNYRVQVLSEKEILEFVFHDYDRVLKFITLILASSDYYCAITKIKAEEK